MPLMDPHYQHDTIGKVSGLSFHYLVRCFLFSNPVFAFMIFWWLVSFITLIVLYAFWVSFPFLQPIYLTMQWFRDMKNYGVIAFFDGLGVIFGTKASSSEKGMAAGMVSHNFFKGFFYKFLGKMFPNSQIDDEYVQALAAVSDPNTPEEERQKHLEVIKCRIPSNSENSSSISNKLGDEVSKAACAEEEARIQSCIKEKHIDIPADASTAKRLMLSWENAMSAIDCQDSDVVNGYKAIGKKTSELNSNLKSFISKQFGILQADINKHNSNSPATSPATNPSSNTKTTTGVTVLSNSNPSSNTKTATGVTALSNSNSNSNTNVNNVVGMNATTPTTTHVKSSTFSQGQITYILNNGSMSLDIMGIIRKYIDISETIVETAYKSDIAYWNTYPSVIQSLSSQQLLPPQIDANAFKSLLRKYFLKVPSTASSGEKTQMQNMLVIDMLYAFKAHMAKYNTNTGSSTASTATTTPVNNDSGSADENLAKARRVLHNLSSDISACFE